MKNKKAEYEAELSKLKSPRELQREELNLSEKITGLEKKIHYQNVEQVSASYFCIVFLSTRLRYSGACKAINKQFRLIFSHKYFYWLLFSSKNIANNKRVYVAEKCSRQTRKAKS